MITLSLNPTYLCNFRCDFCYLTPDQLSDKNKLSLGGLNELLSEIKSSGYEVGHVDLYGGEIALLPNDYLEQLDSMLFDHFHEPEINLITNLSLIHPYFLKEHINLSVSFDFEARQCSDKVFQNMLNTPKSLSVLMLASKELLNMDVGKMVNLFNNLGNVNSVEIKPYSSNQANSQPISHADFEVFIIKWLESPIKKNFEFINEKYIKESVSKKRNAFSNDHLYITPSGKFAVLEFDKNDNEFFMELDSFKDYVSWTELEKNRVSENSYCSQCEYLGSCLTEHYRHVEDLNQSCNGYFNLLKYYEEHF